MQFFNFFNLPTFHFFYYAMHSGKVPIDALIARAFEMIETGEDNTADGKLWHEAGVNTSECVRDELAGLLEEVANSLFARFGESAVPNTGFWLDLADAAGPEQYTSASGEMATPEKMAGADVEHLFMPILVDALRDISFETVAQAILIARGKWNPDKELEDLFPLPEDPNNFQPRP